MRFTVYHPGGLQNETWGGYFPCSESDKRDLMIKNEYFLIIYILVLSYVYVSQFVFFVAYYAADPFFCSTMSAGQTFISLEDVHPGA